jgi:putative ABC transport system permease protein
MLSVYTALDGYFQKAEIPDYWFTVADKNACTKFEEFAEEKGYDSKTLELLQINPAKIEINGEKFSYSGTTGLSTLKNSTKIFNSTDDKEITNVPNGEIYMSSVIVGNEEYNLHVGDTVTISVGDRKKSFTLAGSVKDAIFGSEMMGMTRIMVSDSDFSFFCSDDSSMLYSFFVNSDNSDFIDELNNLDIQTLFIMDYDEVKLLYVMDMLIAGTILIVSICLILISFVILHFTINFTMSEEFREIGVMKAIGIRNLKIRGIYITKYFAMAIIGAGLGFGFSIPFGNLLLKDVSKNMVMGTSGGILINLICALLTAVIVVGFCYFCTRKIKKISPIAAIRNGENGERYTRKGFIHLSRTRISTVPFMAINDIFSGLKRFLAMILIFVLGLLLIIIPVNTITTLQSDNLITWFSMAKCDHVLSEETILDSGDNKKMLEDKLDEIRSCLSENNIQADIFQEVLFKMKISHGDKKTTSLAFQGIGDITVDEYMYESGSAPQNVNEVAITSIIADRIGVQIGDDVQIQDGETSQTPYELYLIRHSN